MNICLSLVDVVAHFRFLFQMNFLKNVSFPHELDNFYGSFSMLLFWMALWE